MGRLLLPLVAVAALAPFANAAIKFTSPKAGATLQADTSIDVKWEDDGSFPQVTDLLQYELFLVAGGNEAGENLVRVVLTTQGQFVAGNSASGMVGKQMGEDSPKNAYFLKMVATGKNGGVLETFSPRFSYSGMTAKWPVDPSLKKGLDSISGTDGPDGTDTVVKPGAAPGAAVGAPGDYNMEYTLQTGPTRYAPMQPIPPKTITAKNTKPLYPTSSVQIAKTKLPIPKIQTTLTQSQTFVVQSRENTVAPAPQPSDDMARFLNRWKD